MCCIKMKETLIPRSSNIAQIDYDSDEQVMTIVFQSDGRAYEYRPVPQTVWMGIQNAPSKGSYFYRNIRGRYSEQEV